MKPPMVCKKCADGEPLFPGVYYCSHRKVYAVIKQDRSGWHLTTGCDKEEFNQYMDQLAENIKMTRLKIEDGPLN